MHVLAVDAQQRVSYKLTSWLSPIHSTRGEVLSDARSGMTRQGPSMCARRMYPPEIVSPNW